MTERGHVSLPLGNDRSPTSVHRIGTPVMGISLWGSSPLCEIGISRRSVYQMATSREQALGEGNCASEGDRAWEGSLRMVG
jgi:hypothetical protein